ncbi:ABC transporter ATP-binding protein [Acuticoccus sp. MNP-M23]|uniref:ABC transporter ATP-binding protein n=1 Tax=Acuticoccus sp. MNP-M23 TaxID=3072793 RepID=UPI002815243C|nr:ABC transporter ATP-binding protein [Acuticoccus sp. MNP-M23]WMS40915.1 ABC transporter ATP-binding protein [Acuticoccus sp. MNP-M23]
MPEPDSHLLEVRDLSVRFHAAGQTVDAVKGVSWHLDRGETLAILGESGSGKSVSASAIMNLIDCPPAEIVSGEILFDGKDLLKMDDEARREINGRRIAMIFQDPFSHLNPVYPIGWQIVEAMTAHDMSRADAKARATELLRRVGITDKRAMRKFPHQFSGGQRQRIMIAMALALKADILIADEPTTALDVTVQADVLALLEELQAETGMGLLLITHDLGVVAEVADRVVVMSKGEAVEKGTAHQIYHAPKHPYTRALVGAVPGQGALHEPQSANAPILVVEDMRKSYGGFDALKGVSFEMMAGETLAIVGESGSGKSTLARTLLQLEEPTGGRALWHGSNLFEKSGGEMQKVRRAMQMVFQDPTQSLNPRMSVFQIVSEAFVIHREILPKARWKARVEELLVQVGLGPEHMDRYPHQFSGGQRQRIAIARALAMEPELIVCDEAVSSLDVSIQAQVIKLLDRLRRELGIAFMFIAHDLPVVRDFADRVIVMKDGEIVETGTVREIFENPQVPYTQALLAASLDPDPDVQATRRADRDAGRTNAASAA